jgi:G3E family GTPase
MNPPTALKTGEKAGVFLLSGFLGSGKTTLLKRIFSWGIDLSDTVIVVNEFGRIGIDGSLLKNSGSDVIELTSGCICCTLKADLMQCLTSIWKRFKPRRIFIESSGVADPASIVSVLKEPRLLQSMEIFKILTVLDADLWEAREVFGPVFYNQLKMADLILLNKIDLVDNEKVTHFLKEIHEVIPDSRVIPSIHCGIDPESLWTDTKPKSFGRMLINFFQPVHKDINSQISAHHHDQYNHDAARHMDFEGRPIETTPYVTFSYKGSRFMDETCFKRFISQLPWEVFRIKGPVRFVDRVVMLNFVGGKSNWTPWDGEPETRLAFVGWEISEEITLRKLKECVSSIK